MNFSSRTSSLDVQHAIEDSIEKRTKVGVRVLTVPIVQLRPSGWARSTPLHRLWGQQCFVCAATIKAEIARSGAAPGVLCRTRMAHPLARSY
jgi:hypothetical protein